MHVITKVTFMMFHDISTSIIPTMQSAAEHVVNVVMISTSCERRFNAQEEMLALSGTQRHVGGPLCTNKLQKKACSVVCPSQTTRQLALATYSRDGVICIWPRAI